MPTNIISSPHFSDQLPLNSKQPPKYNPGDLVLVEPRRASLWFNLKEDQRLGVVLARFSAEEVVPRAEVRLEKNSSNCSQDTIPFQAPLLFQGGRIAEEIVIGPFWYLVWAFGAEPGRLKKRGGLRLWEGFLTKYDKA